MDLNVSTKPQLLIEQFTGKHLLFSDKDHEEAFLFEKREHQYNSKAVGTSMLALKRDVMIIGNSKISMGGKIL